MRHTKLLVALAAVVVALGAFLCALMLNPPQRLVDTVLLHDSEPAAIQRVYVQNEHGPFEVRAAGDGYEVHNIPAELVDYDRFMQLMNACARVQAVRLVDERADDLSIFGLSEPAASLTVEYDEGLDVNLAIGNVEPVSGDVYFAEEGKRAVYLMDGLDAANLTCAPKDYINRQITEPLQWSSPLSAIIDATFLGGELAESVVIESVLYGGEDLQRQALSYGAASHLVQLGDDSFELNQTYGVELLGSLMGIRAVDIEAYNCTDEMLEIMGFFAPWMLVDYDVIVDDEGTVYNQMLSVVPTQDGQYLIRRGSEDIVYRVAPLSFMHINSGELMMRWYLSPLLMDLEGLRVTAGDNVLDFALGGEDNANRTATLNGEAFDMDVFRKFFRLITSASNDGVHMEETEVTGEALLTVEFDYIDPQKPPDVMEFYAGDVRKLIVVINGNAVEYGLREMFATRALEACEAILAGEDFDENW